MHPQVVLFAAPHQYLNPRSKTLNPILFLRWAPDLGENIPLETQQAALEQLPTDSLKRIHETYKAMKAVGGSSMAAAAFAAPAAPMQQPAGKVRRVGVGGV